jgi:hypothetical protein
MKHANRLMTIAYNATVVLRDIDNCQNIDIGQIGTVFDTSALDYVKFFENCSESVDDLNSHEKTIVTYELRSLLGDSIVRVVLSSLQILARKVREIYIYMYIYVYT